MVDFNNKNLYDIAVELFGFNNKDELFTVMDNNNLTDSDILTAIYNIIYGVDYEG